MSFKTDKMFGRRGGNLIDSDRPSTDGPPCEICHAPMTVGQKRTHFVCSPPAPCCGFPTALIPNLAAHRAACEQADQ